MVVCGYLELVGVVCVCLFLVNEYGGVCVIVFGRLDWFGDFD